MSTWVLAATVLASHQFNASAARGDFQRLPSLLGATDGQTAKFEGVSMISIQLSQYEIPQYEQ